MRFRSTSEAEDTDLEWIAVGGDDPPASAAKSADDHQIKISRSATGLILAVLAIGVFLLTLTDGGESDGVEGATPTTPLTGEDSTEGRGSSNERALTIAGIPEPLLAAELFHSSPSHETLSGLFDAIGGIEGATMGSAEGNFDLVTFNPLDNDQLLASRRSSYGSAENQLVNESWTVTDGEVVQQLNAPELAHDYAHFNPDGTTTVWIRVEPTTSYTSRIPTIFDGRGSSDARSPVFAGRAVAVDATLFALTDSPAYSSTQVEYDELVVDDGVNVTRLDSGAPWAWLDSPAPGIVAAYPTSADGGIALWGVASHAQIDEHPLARQPFQRAAISGDGTVALTIDFDDRLHRIDLDTGEIALSFGSVDPGGIAVPISLNHDGTIALTVDRGGTVSMWWVASGEPIFVVDGDSGPTRVLGERRAARTSSVIAADTSRVALRFLGTPVTWNMMDTSPDSWIAIACKLAGRGLTTVEAIAAGVPTVNPACSTN
ncbi:MAG: WD40 repeat domain-containing protein [Acidimicrobiales bacterium]